MKQLLEMLLSNSNQSNLTDIMSKLGLDEGQAQQAISALLPSISKGISSQVQSQNTNILNQLTNAQQQQYMDDDDSRLYSDDAIHDGNHILGEILGSKDNSRALAGQAAEQTGLDSGVLKKLLPMVASMAMGSLGKQANIQGLSSQGQGGIASMIGSMLDQDGDGFGLDDVASLAKKFFR